MGLLDDVREAVRVRGYSENTADQYTYWIERFVRFQDLRHPMELGVRDVATYLGSLAMDRGLSPSSQNQAHSALLFLYREVLDIELDGLEEVARARLPRSIPPVLTRDEVARLLAELEGVPLLQAQLLYGAGLRLMECLRLRAKDVELRERKLFVRRGKGDADRTALLPDLAVEPLRRQLVSARKQHERDLLRGAGWVALPGGLAAKYPSAGREWRWQWVFPATRIYEVPGERRRHHIHETTLQRHIREAVRRADILKPATCHTLRHSFATHLHQGGVPPTTIQKLLGHSDLKTTMHYLHLLESEVSSVKSPLDTLMRLDDKVDDEDDDPDEEDDDGG